MRWRLLSIMTAIRFFLPPTVIPAWGARIFIGWIWSSPGEPVNVGLAVNTQGDEFGFSVDASGEWGYFSSDVAGRRRIYRCRLGVEVALAPASYVSVEVRNEAGVRVMPEELLVADADRQDTLAWYDAAYGGGRKACWCVCRQGVYCG